MNTTLPLSSTVLLQTWTVSVHCLDRAALSPVWSLHTDAVVRRAALYLSWTSEKICTSSRIVTKYYSGFVKYCDRMYLRPVWQLLCS